MGSGLLFQLNKKKEDIRKETKINKPKLNKKEQKTIDMKRQKSIDDAWN